MAFKIGDEVHIVLDGKPANSVFGATGSVLKEGVSGRVAALMPPYVGVDLGKSGPGFNELNGAISTATGYWIAETLLAKRAVPAGDPSKLAECWVIAETVIPVSPRVLLYGPPGVGKTYIGLTHGLKTNQNVYSVTLTEDSPAAELRGHFIAKGGDFIWMDGPAALAWREGARLVINELSRASGDALSFLLAILDDPESARITLPNGDTLTPTEDFSVVATMNGDPIETLNPALRDRFPVSIEITDAHSAALMRLPKDLRKLAASSVKSLDPERQASVRVWLEFAALREETSPEIAAKACFGVRAEELLKALKIAKA